ncbi:RidA family protein [Phenylobacterium sp. LjRoot225]|uniref:RidA family protein n=1 Tax=Phenylobacterium sp. LjRoot225 TaxID=3342285 RepID=UPI003ECE1BAC
MKHALCAATAALAGAFLAQSACAQEVVHQATPEAAIATLTAVPPGYGMVYVSGMVPPVIDPKAPAGSTATYGDTKTQTLGVLKRLSDALESRGLSFADVVMMRVYLVGDPAKGGNMDFAGMMEAYKQHFGTAAQPNKPARVTVQVASLVGPGMLVEIEVQAAAKKP